MSFQMSIWFRNVAFAALVETISLLRIFAGFCILDLELCGVTKVLKYLTVFVRNCDFHGGISF